MKHNTNAYKWYKKTKKNYNYFGEKTINVSHRDIWECQLCIQQNCTVKLHEVSH